MNYSDVIADLWFLMTISLKCNSVGGDLAERLYKSVEKAEEIIRDSAKGVTHAE